MNEQLKTGERVFLVVVDESPEMRNALRYALTLADTRRIEMGDLPEEIRRGANIALPAPQRLRDSSRPSTPTTVAVSDSDRLVSALRSQHWNITRVAAELNLCRATVYRRMKRYGIVPPTQYC